MDKKLVQKYKKFYGDNSQLPDENKMRSLIIQKENENLSKTNKLINKYKISFGDVSPLPDEKEIKQRVMVKAREIYVRRHLNKPILICTGSYMNGLDNFDIVKWSGHRELNNEEENRIWQKTTEIDMLQNCPHINYIKREGEDIVNYSDTYFKFIVYSEEDLKKVKIIIKKQIKEIINQ